MAWRSIDRQSVEIIVEDRTVERGDLFAFEDFSWRKPRDRTFVFVLRRPWGCPLTYLYALKQIGHRAETDELHGGTTRRGLGRRVIAPAFILFVAGKRERHLAVIQIDAVGAL